MCGIFGAVARKYDPDLVRKVILGLFDNQHRGQESAGVAWSDGSAVWVYKDYGLTPDVFKKGDLEDIKIDKPTMMMGQTRYSTSGGKIASKKKSSKLIPPQYTETSEFGKVALVHNGNIPSVDEKIRELEREGVIFNRDKNTEITDTEFMLKKIIHLAKSNEKNLTAGIKKFIETTEGTYSSALIYYGGIFVFRDNYGNRPIFWCEDDNTIFFASETCALDSIDDESIMILDRGSILFLPNSDKTDYKMRLTTGDKAKSVCAHCDFEDLYLSRPSSKTFGSIHVRDFRQKVGEELARLFPVPNAHFVSFVPDSGLYYAIGFSRFSEKNLEFIYERNPYVQGRSFISPTPGDRAVYSEIKNHLMGHVVKGKRIVLTDDSIVRGDTIKLKIKQLKNAGAEEIHLRVGSPEFKNPCYYGIDTPTKNELISTKLSEYELCEYLGADSLKFLPLESLSKVQTECGYDPGNFCKACFTGDYPIPLN